MANLPENLKYTKEHEWMRIEGDVATVGITQYAQEALGDLVFVELPPVGKTVKPGENFAVVESVKAASEVYSPLGGEVVEVNSALSDKPETINEAPYEDGWIAKIRIANKADVDAAMNASAYAEFLNTLN